MGNNIEQIKDSGSMGTNNKNIINEYEAGESTNLQGKTLLRVTSEGESEEIKYNEHMFEHEWFNSRIENLEEEVKASKKNTRTEMVIKNIITNLISSGSNQELLSIHRPSEILTISEVVVI